MKAIWRALNRTKRMKGTISNVTSGPSRAKAGAAGAAAAQMAAASGPQIACVSTRLRDLADELDTHGSSSAGLVGSQLQLLAQQLLQPMASPALAAQASGTSGQKGAATSTKTPAARGSSKAAGSQSTAAGVAALERSYAAPAAPGAVDAEPTDMQPLTKKQRKALKTGGQPRVFDFNKYEQRSVVLQLMYVGWSYQGFARQADGENTIEGVLFPALRRVKLIPGDAEISSLGYSRCGRTDKGVSALGQVLGLRLRSAVLAGQPLPAVEQELDYLTIINRALPDTIRVLGWCDAPHPEFSARFSCASREYKYFIVQDGSLDVAAMRQAAQHLLGEHDFRNFCKADVLQVQNFMRCVLSVSLEPVDCSCQDMTVLALHIKGTAFLWHQIRCIAAVLLMVGRGLEQPSVVQQLLDTSRVPCKPQYSMAAEEPLLLYRCSFDELQQWHRSETALSRNLATVGAQLQQHLVAAALTGAIYQQLQQDWTALHSSRLWDQHLHQQHGHQEPQQQHNDQIAHGGQRTVQACSRWVMPKPSHIPLLKRATEPSMEERFAKAGISLEVLNQPGGSRSKMQDG